LSKTFPTPASQRQIWSAYLLQFGDGRC